MVALMLLLGALLHVVLQSLSALAPPPHTAAFNDVQIAYKQEPRAATLSGS